MTYTEFKSEFNRIYNNLASTSAPGLDDYDISLLLTEAQESIIKAIVSGKKAINILGDRFEVTEDARRSVQNLVDTLTVASFTASSDTNLTHGSTSGKYLNLGNNPPDIWWIIQEHIVASSTPCGDNIKINVYPLSHDQYNIVMDNPYRRPNVDRAYRMDTKNGIEIHTPYTLVKYIARYIAKPSPIIVASLTLAGNSELALYYTSDLSIDGISSPQTCTLNTKLHRAILMLAIQTAILRYKQGSLENVIQTVPVT